MEDEPVEFLESNETLSQGHQIEIFFSFVSGESFDEAMNQIGRFIRTKCQSNQKKPQKDAPLPLDSNCKVLVTIYINSPIPIPIPRGKDAKSFESGHIFADSRYMTRNFPCTVNIGETQVRFQKGTTQDFGVMTILNKTKTRLFEFGPNGKIKELFLISRLEKDSGESKDSGEQISQSQLQTLLIKLKARHEEHKRLQETMTDIHQEHKKLQEQMTEWRLTQEEAAAKAATEHEQSIKELRGELSEMKKLFREMKEEEEYKSKTMEEEEEQKQHLLWKNKLELKIFGDDSDSTEKDKAAFGFGLDEEVLNGYLQTCQEEWEQKGFQFLYRWKNNNRPWPSPSPFVK